MYKILLLIIIIIIIIKNVSKVSCFQKNIEYFRHILTKKLKSVTLDNFIRLQNGALIDIFSNIVANSFTNPIFTSL